MGSLVKPFCRFGQGREGPNELLLLDSLKGDIKTSKKTSEGLCLDSKVYHEWVGLIRTLIRD
jgi:hypothetical protein